MYNLISKKNKKEAKPELEKIIKKLSLSSCKSKQAQLGSFACGFSSDVGLKYIRQFSGYYLLIWDYLFVFKIMLVEVD